MKPAAMGRLIAAAVLLLWIASVGCAALSGRTSAQSTRDKYRQGARDPGAEAGAPR